MRAPLIAFVLLPFWASLLPGAGGRQSTAQRSTALHKYGLDPTTSLESRIRPAPTAILKMFSDAGEAPPTGHPLTAEERQTVANAFAGLTPLHRQVLAERLRSVSFLDGMPNTALTSTVDTDDPYRLFDITVRAGVLHETVSEFLTNKERTCFDTTGSSLRVSIEAGMTDALRYVLLHEATHVVDSTMQIAHTDDTWIDRTHAVARFADPLLDKIRFRSNGSVLPIERAEAVYAALRRTPFPSIYGSSNWHDDLAESVALYHLSQKLAQPYRIVISDGGTETFAYEPMKSDLVRSRWPQLARFYDSP